MTHKDSMEAINSSYPPCSVLSMDHTFNVNKRTTQMTTGPPPEKRSNNEPKHVKHVSIKENAVLMTIGVNGQVKYASDNTNRHEICYLEYSF